MSNPIWRAIEDMQKQLEVQRLEIERLHLRADVLGHALEKAATGMVALEPAFMQMIADVEALKAKPKLGRPRKDDEARAH